MPTGTSIHQKNQLSGKKHQRRPGHRQLFQGVPYHHYTHLIAVYELI